MYTKSLGKEPGGLFCLLALVFAALFSSCVGFWRTWLSNESGKAFAALLNESPDGFYEGCGEGFRGPIGVRLRVEAGALADIEVTEFSDDQFTGGEALQELIESVLQANSVEVDAVSGATETCEGFLEAVQNAIISP